MSGTLATVFNCGNARNMASNLTFGRVVEWFMATVSKTVVREHRQTLKTPRNSAKLERFQGVAASAERAESRNRSGTNCRIGRHSATPYPETKKALTPEAAS